jgi:hypothetical protein
MNQRRTDGDETCNRLLIWTKGQKPSERLAVHILRAEGYKSVDTSHPLGGQDGLKDIIAIKDNIKWIGAAYFPRGQKNFNEIKDKFIDDSKGIEKNKVSGLVFVTNQELTLGNRQELKTLGKPNTIDIYHLERVASILDSPANYGIRLEFLDIELTKEEQLSYFASRDNEFEKLNDKLEVLMIDYNAFKRSFEYDEDNENYKERTEDEIYTIIDEITDKIWYDRHQMLKYHIKEKATKVDTEIWNGAIDAAKKVEEKYGIENLGLHGDFEWGMLNGKLSALRWVTGDEWDMLDT